ncbi:MAG: ankyrin repeat domain-containing protein, partial [Ilumatobacteraceae bacterium]
PGDEGYESGGGGDDRGASDDEGGASDDEEYDSSDDDVKGITLAHKAAARGDVPTLERMYNAILHQKDRRGRSPAHVASTPEVLKVLAKAGCDLEEVDFEGNRPVHSAAAFSDVSCLEFLFEHGCDMEAPGEHASRPLHVAVTYEHVDAVRFLLRIGCDLNAPDCDGYHPGHFAASLGDEEILEILRVGGWNLDSATADGMRAIHCAAENGRVNVMNYLFLAGAEVEVPNKWGYYPIHMAAGKNQVRAVSFLHRIGCDMNVINFDGTNAALLAVVHGNIDVLRFLFSVGWRADTAPSDQAVYLAISYNRMETLRVVIDMGAPLDVMNFLGMPPAHTAVMNDSVEGLTILWQAGCNFDCLDASGTSTAQRAASKGHIGILDVLARAGCSLDCFHPNAPSNQTRPLHQAIRRNNIDAVAFLLHIGCDPDSHEDIFTERRPLHVAAHCGHANIVNILLAAGCDAAAHYKSLTAAHLAGMAGHIDVLKILVRHPQCGEAVGKNIPIRRGAWRSGCRKVSDLALKFTSTSLSLLETYAMKADATSMEKMREDEGLVLHFAMLYGYAAAREVLVADMRPTPPVPFSRYVARLAMRGFGVCFDQDMGDEEAAKYMGEIRRSGYTAFIEETHLSLSVLAELALKKKRAGYPVVTREMTQLAPEAPTIYSVFNLPKGARGTVLSFYTDLVL